MSNNFVTDKYKIDINQNNKIPNLKEFIKYLDQTLKLFDQHIAEEEFEKKDSDVYKLFIMLFNIYTDLDTKKTKNESVTESPGSKHPKASNGVPKASNGVPKTDTGANEIDVNSIILQHIENRKKHKKENPKWENNRSRLESERLVREIYNKSLLELQTTDNNGPILFTDAKIKKDLFECQTTDSCFRHNKTSKKRNNYVDRNDNHLLKSTNNILQTDTETNNSDMYTDNDDGDANTEFIVHVPSKQIIKKSNKHCYEKTDDIDKKINMLKKLLNK
jgi:hypothetical protein